MALGQAGDFTLVEADIAALAGGEVADVAIRGAWLDGREIWRT